MKMITYYQVYFISSRLSISINGMLLRGVLAISKVPGPGFNGPISICTGICELYLQSIYGILKVGHRGNIWLEVSRIFKICYNRRGTVVIIDLTYLKYVITFSSGG